MVYCSKCGCTEDKYFGINNNQLYCRRCIVFKDENVKNNVSKIIIQGHTDSQPYAGAKSYEESYFKNMDLSVRRASSVAEYIVFSSYNDKKSYEKDLLKIISIEGKGSSEPILVDGKEDYDKSRRVELKLTFKDKSILNAIKI